MEKRHFYTSKDRLLHVKKPPLRRQKTVFEVVKGHLSLFIGSTMPAQ